MPFSLLPEFVSVVFMKETTHYGDFTNSFSYANCNVTSLALFKNGIAHFLNQESQGAEILENSHRHYLWYDEFLKCYGSEASSVSPQRFFHDLFVFTFDLTSVPLFWEHSKDNTSDRLNLVSAGILDLEVTFKAPLAENLILCHWLSKIRC